MDRATLDLTQPRDAHIDARLRSDLIAWFGTVRPDGRPHLVAVWFLWDGETILVFSQPNQKVRNVRHNSHVTLGLDDTKQGGDVVMIEGEATLVDDATPSLPAYAAKYAGELQAMGWTPESMAQTYTQAIRITPTRLRTIS